MEELGDILNTCCRCYKEENQLYKSPCSEYPWVCEECYIELTTLIINLKGALNEYN